MKNRKLWWAIIVFLVVVSFIAMWPPTSRDLIETFVSEGQNTNATFNAIVDNARTMEKKNPDPQQEFNYLRDAIGTNDIRPFFPSYNISATAKDPTSDILAEVQKAAAGKIKLGLDLQGGVQFTVSLETNKALMDTNIANNTMAKDQVQSRLIEQAVEVLRKRVDKFGVAEPTIQPAGANHILISLPGISEAVQKQAMEELTKPASLAFRMVHKESAKLISEGITEPGYEVLKLASKDRTGKQEYTPVLVEKRLANGLTGKYIKRAYPERDPTTGAPEIGFEFNSEGAEKFGK